MTHANRHSPLHPIWSVIGVMLMFAALDDISNIAETDLFLEYAALGCCLAWFVVVAIHLLRRRDYLLGAFTVIGVATMTWAVFYGARPQASTVEHLPTRAAFVALVSVTLTLFTFDGRADRKGPPRGGAII